MPTRRGYALTIEIANAKLSNGGRNFRASHTSGNASGNESDDTTIPPENLFWDCAIILRRYRASEADQRDYPGKHLEQRLSGALTRISVFYPLRRVC